MKDYSKWPQETVAVTTLRLDASNPRIPPSDQEKGQRELIHELVEHDSVLELAKEIVEQGFWPSETLIGLKDDGKPVILEGNRRLSALKLIADPNLAPDAYFKRFKALSDQVTGNALKSVRVLFAPSREAAAPMIMARHTRLQVERWSPIQQARFYASLRKDGVTVKEMAKEYGVSPGDIQKNLVVYDTYAAACNMDLPAAVGAIVRNPRLFEMSTLERIVSSQPAKKILGIEFDEEGRLKGKGDKDDFRKAFTRVVSDVAQKKMNTRSLNNATQIKDYLDGIVDGKTPKAKDGTFTTDDLKQPDAKASPATPAPAKKKPEAKRDARVSSVLMPSHVKCLVKNNRIKEVCEELRKLKLDTFPNAAAVLLRLLLDLGVSEYMDRSGKIKPLLERAKKQNKPADWYPSLNQMLGALANDTDVDLPPLVRKKVIKLITDEKEFISVDLLDAFAHNKYELPKVRDLRTLWDGLEPLVELILDPSRIKKASP